MKSWIEFVEIQTEVIVSQISIVAVAADQINCDNHCLSIINEKYLFQRAEIFCHLIRRFRFDWTLAKL